MAAAMPSPGATLRVRAERVAGHEEEDGTDEWGPPVSERSRGTQLSEREEREEEIRAARTFRMTLLTQRRRVRPPWRATSAKVVKM